MQGQGELDARAVRYLGRSPDAPAVKFDDGTADRWHYGMSTIFPSTLPSSASFCAAAASLSLNVLAMGIRRLPLRTASANLASTVGFGCTLKASTRISFPSAALGCPNTDPRTPPKLRNQLPDHLSIHGVCDCIQIRK